MIQKVSRKGPKELGVPRMPRVKLVAEHGVQLENVFGVREATIGIDNLSISGVGIKKSAFLNVPEEGESISCELALGEVNIPLELSVIHVSKGILGTKMSKPHPMLVESYQSYFERELDMIYLSEEQSKRGEIRNFRSQKGQTEVSISRDSDESLKHFSMTYEGMCFEFDEKANVQWSTKKANEDRLVTRETIHLFRRLIVNFELLESFERLRMLRAL